MNVSDFYPVFYTEDIESEIKYFTDILGFKVIHRPNIELLDYVVLENDKKRRIDVVCSHFPADAFKSGFLGMRVNVDNFDEAVSYFASQGYTLFGESHETASQISGMLAKEGEMYLVLFHHKK